MPLVSGSGQSSYEFNPFLPHCSASRFYKDIASSPLPPRQVFDPELLKDLEWFQKFVVSFNLIVLLPSSPRISWFIECDSTLQVRGTFPQQHYYVAPYLYQIEALNLVHTVTALLPSEPHNFTIITNTDNAA